MLLRTFYVSRTTEKYVGLEICCEKMSKCRVTLYYQSLRGLNFLSLVYDGYEGS